MSIERERDRDKDRERDVAYHKLINKHKWLEERVIKIWGFHKPITRWLHVIKTSWCSRLMLRAKVFIWRVMVEDLPLGDTLKKTLLKDCVSFIRWNWNKVGINLFHAPMARMVWRCISFVWTSLTGVSLSSFSWVFAHMENNELMARSQIIFEFLRYWGLWFNWNMRNAFISYSQVGVRKYVLKLKGLLLWQLTVLEKSRNLIQEERELCNVTYHHIRHLNWCVG